MKRKIPDDIILMDTPPKHMCIEDKPLDDDDDDDYYSDEEPEDGNRYLGLIFSLFRQMQKEIPIIN